MFATYFVPQENAPRLKEKLDKLARKAGRLGCAAILYSVAKTFSEPHPDRELAAKGAMMVYEAITVQGEPPTLNGWVFVATLEHETLPDGRTVNIVRSHGEESLPARFRDATPDHCDHCGTHRRRNNTFVVRHAQTGEWKQVGRQCLKDFLGLNKSPGALARYATFLLSLGDMVAEEMGGYGSGEPETYGLREFLAWTLQFIDDDCWTSRTKARELSEFGPPVMATADQVLARFAAVAMGKKPKYEPPKPTERTYAEVDEALAWLEAQDAENNDYIHNCQVIAELGAVRWRTAGYAASIVSSHRRAKDRLARRQVLVANGTEHVGTVGKRGEFKLTLLKVLEIDGQWGVSYLHKFADPAGNQVVWFASNRHIVPTPWDRQAFAEKRFEDATVDDEPMVVGASYVVKATVKDHGSYDGQAQTKVNRVVVQELSKPPKKRRSRKAKKAKVA